MTPYATTDARWSYKRGSCPAAANEDTLVGSGALRELRHVLDGELLLFAEIAWQRWEKTIFSFGGVHSSSELVYSAPEQTLVFPALGPAPEGILAAAERLRTAPDRRPPRAPRPVSETPPMTTNMRTTMKTKTKTKTALTLLPLVMVGAVASLAVHRARSVPAASGAQESGQATGQTAEEAAAGATVANIGADGWRTGKRHVYRLSFSTQLESGAGRSPVLQLQAELESTVLAQRQGTVDVQWKMTSLVFEDAPNAAASSSPGRAQMRAAFSLPYLVSYDGQGRPLAVRFDPKMPGQAKGFIKEIVASIQFVRPGTTASSWTALDSTPAGDIEARYAGLDGARHYVRDRAGRTHAAGASHGGGPAQAILPARDSFQLALDGRVERVVATQRAEAEVPGTGARLAVITDTALILRSTTEAPATEPAPDAAGAIAEAMVSPPGQAGDAETSRLRGILGGAKLAELVRQAGDASVLADDKRRRGVARRLGALITLDAAALPDVAARARSAADKRPFIAALTESGSPAAQSALAALAADASLSPGARLQAVDALGSLDKPTRQAQSALDEARRDPDPEVRKSAALGLGAAAFHAAATDPDAARRSVEALREQLRAARSPAEVVDALEALGNTGSADALDDLTAALAAADLSVRTAAARALRSIPGERANRLLAGLIAADPSSDVRIAALFAAEFRALAPLFEAVQSVCRGAGDVGVRRAAASVLAAALRRGGEEAAAVPLLSWVAQNDADADLRALAAASLANAG